MAKMPTPKGEMYFKNIPPAKKSNELYMGCLIYLYIPVTFPGPLPTEVCSGCFGEHGNLPFHSIKKVP